MCICNIKTLGVNKKYCNTAGCSAHLPKQEVIRKLFHYFYELILDTRNRHFKIIFLMLLFLFDVFLGFEHPIPVYITCGKVYLVKTTYGAFRLVPPLDNPSQTQACKQTVWPGLREVVADFSRCRFLNTDQRTRLRAFVVCERLHRPRKRINVQNERL